MHFGLTEEQELLQQTVRGFVEGECPPSRLRELFDAGSGHDPALWKGLCEMGLPGLAVPERHGGAGLELLELALVAEELGRGALPGPLLGHALAALAVELAGSQAQRERWLPALAGGEVIGTLAWGEDDDVWEPEAWSLALCDGVLSGRKRHVPHGALARLFVVGTAGGGLALVERGARGLRVEDAAGVDRTRPVAELGFDTTPAEPLAGDVESAAARVRDAGLALLAADAFGAASRLSEITVEYAKSRRQFGAPIAAFQSVKHQLADMATDVELSRGLFWYAAHAWGHLPDEAERSAAIAKAHVTDRACRVARAAVELHGGLGFTWECDVHVWFKRAMFDRAWLGAPAHHRRRAAAFAAGAAGRGGW